MTTIVERTIGSGGDYTTLQAWEDACPANLVKADQIWRGLVLNQVFSGSSTMLSISGTTTDATHYVELTTAPGASFLDHPNKASNALRADSANGALISGSAGWGATINDAQNYTRLSRLQVKHAGMNGSTFASSSSNSDVNQCIIEGENYSGPYLAMSGGMLRNSLVVQRRTTADSFYGVTGGKLCNVTVVATGSKSTDAAVMGVTGAVVLRNVYVGNFSMTTAGNASFSCTRCFTDMASPPAGWTGSVPFDATTFEATTDGTHDLRLRSGSRLIDAGVTDATYAGTDIIGTVRPCGSAYDVGAWEFATQPTAMALAGRAQALASASGALAFDVVMTGAALGVATASGALSTGIAVGGAAAAIASASGTLVLGVVLSGEAIAKSLASGTLISRFALDGAAQVQSSASGSLAVSSPAVLAGDATARAAAIGMLTVQFALSGAAIAQAAASGTVSFGGTSALAGVAQATPAASGALSVAVPLAGSAHVVAGITGDLTSGAALTGTAVAVAAASGQLWVTVQLSGAAMAQSIASGGLSLRVPLSAAAIAHAHASGILSGGPERDPGNARYTVHALRREFMLHAHPRNLAARARQRNFTVTHAH